MILKILSCVVLIIISSTVNVNSQTCENPSQYGSCSSNSACGCLPMAQFTDIGLCALLGLNCSRLSPCQYPGNTCEQSDYICVLHPRCDSNPLCYPMAMVDQRLCPPGAPTTTIRPTTNIISNYSSELTIDDGIFCRLGSPPCGYYYEAIEVVVSTTGIYTFTSEANIDGVGYLYLSTFDPSNLPNNLIVQDEQSGGNNQFRFSVYLEAGVSYTLVFTTHDQGVTGPFSVIASGSDDVYFIRINIIQTTTFTSTMTTSTFPTPWPTTSMRTLVISNYSDELTNSSEKYPGTEKNCQAIQIIVDTTGTYDLTSISNMDTYGCLYQGSFNPLNPADNALGCNDDSIGNQFKLTYNLIAGVSYTLIFTTYGQSITAPYTVVGSGPSNIDFMPLDIPPISTTITSNFTTPQSFIISNYSSELTSYSENYPGTTKYYEAMEIMINTTGIYTFTSEEYIDGVGYLYLSNFDPSNLPNNLIVQDDQSGGNNQLEFSAHLEAGVSYTLVFTTHDQNVTGPFSVIASGPGNVDFTPINSPQITSTGFPWFITTEATSLISMYSSALTFTNGTFHRDGNSTSLYYYEAIELNVNTTGTYTLTSKSNFDAYGYIYQDSFYPTSLSFNLIAQDDDSGGSSQFQLTPFLQADLTYVLVVTTYSAAISGPFSVVASGRDNIHFNPVNNI